MAKVRERDIERYLVDSVETLGGEIRKVGWKGRRGAPDRFVMLPWAAERCCTQRGAWVELKAPGVPAEDYQLREHERMRNFGQRVVVIDSFEGVDAFLGKK